MDGGTGQTIDWHRHNNSTQLLFIIVIIINIIIISLELLS